MSVGEFNATLDSADAKIMIKNKTENEEPEWHMFNVEWLQLYLRDHGEQCLPSTETDDLLCSDGQPVNKARNFQEVTSSVGEFMCQRIDEHYEQLTMKKRKKFEAQQEKLPAPFFQPGVAKDPSECMGKNLCIKLVAWGKCCLLALLGVKGS